MIRPPSSSSACVATSPVAGTGTVRIDGIDHRDIKLESLRRNIGVVFQDSTMFYRSIADNLRIGKTETAGWRGDVGCGGIGCRLRRLAW